MSKLSVSDLVTRGEQWGADADLVICWPPDEPLRWWSPGRVSGAICVYRTRVPAATPLGALAEGVDLAEVAEAWPSVTPDILRRLVGLCAHLLESMQDHRTSPLVRWEAEIAATYERMQTPEFATGRAEEPRRADEGTGTRAPRRQPEDTPRQSAEELRARALRVTDADLVVELDTGTVHSVPISLFPILADGTPAERQNFDTFQDGMWFYWPDLDEHISAFSIIYPEQTVGIRPGAAIAHIQANRSRRRRRDHTG